MSYSMVYVVVYNFIGENSEISRIFKNKVDAESFVADKNHQRSTKKEFYTIDEFELIE